MRILVIRGGALGDFLVSLPMLRLLREKWPQAHIELLGHPTLAEPAIGRFYLDAARSVHHGPLSAFFMPRAVLDPAWMDYIGTFDLVLSYFYDPDGLFEANLRRCEPEEILTHPPRVPAGFTAPAARHFAGILRPLGLELGNDAASDLFPSPADLDGAPRSWRGFVPARRWSRFIRAAAAKIKSGPPRRGRKREGSSPANFPKARCCSSRARRMPVPRNFSSRPGAICR